MEKFQITEKDPFGFRCRPAVGANLSNSVVQNFGWKWDDKKRCYVVVPTDKKDFQQIVEANLGGDIPTILRNQPGNTALEKLNNAINSGLVELTDPGDMAEMDLTEIPTDKLEGELAIRAAKKGAADLNSALGLKGEDARTFEEYYQGKVNETIKKYIDGKIAELAKTQEVKKDGE